SNAHHPALLSSVVFFLRRLLLLLGFSALQCLQRRRGFQVERGTSLGKFLFLGVVFFGFLFLFHEQVLPLFQQRFDRPLGDQIRPFLERLLLFQLFVELGNFLFEFLVELIFVFGLLVLAGCPL